MPISCFSSFHRNFTLVCGALAVVLASGCQEQDSRSATRLAQTLLVPRAAHAAEPPSNKISKPGTEPAKEPLAATEPATLPPVTVPLTERPSLIGDDATVPEGPVGDAIRRGYALVTHTYEELPELHGNRLHCTSCHIEGGRVAWAMPWVGVTGVFPEYRSRSGSVILLEDRINDCFQRSLNGKPLEPASPEMVAIVSYLSWLSRGTTVGHPVEGRGTRKMDECVPDRTHGRAVFETTCAPCHGLDGQGKPNPENGGYLFPPLWGPKSFNIAAGMARLQTAVRFVKWNMPFGQGGVLSDRDACDAAGYVVYQPRPDYARKREDWPQGGKPKDARY